jgi:hypothetical protein
MERMPQVKASMHPAGAEHLGLHERSISAIVNPERLRRILTRMLDPEEFLAPHGIRGLSRYHLDHPLVLQVGAQEFRVGYPPAESDNAMFGGNLQSGAVRSGSRSTSSSSRPHAVLPVLRRRLPRSSVHRLGPLA